jgi:hypothetical protein
VFSEIYLIHENFRNLTLPFFPYDTNDGVSVIFAALFMSVRESRLGLDHCAVCVCACTTVPRNLTLKQIDIFLQNLVCETCQ